MTCKESDALRGCSTFLADFYSLTNIPTPGTKPLHHCIFHCTGNKSSEFTQDACMFPLICMPTSFFSNHLWGCLFWWASAKSFSGLTSPSTCVIPSQQCCLNLSYVNLHLVTYCSVSLLPMCLLALIFQLLESKDFAFQLFCTSPLGHLNPHHPVLGKAAVALIRCWLSG